MDFAYKNKYNHKAAVDYALRYALKPNPLYRYFISHGDGGGDCSNFISQCLHAGSAPMKYSTKYPWWYNNKGSINTNIHVWSISWSVAHSLFWFLKSSGLTYSSGLRAIEMPNLEALSLGDIIQYEDSTKKIYHSAIITAYTYYRGAKLPLISQHTYNAVNISHIKPSATKMHFMKILV